MNQKEITKKVGTTAGNIIINKSVVSTAGLITILLVILKVTDNIDIGWFWCFAAYWIPIVIVLGFMGLIIIGGLILSLIIVAWDAYDTRKR
jgi:hypothetical protein